MNDLRPIDWSGHVPADPEPPEAVLLDAYQRALATAVDGLETFRQLGRSEARAEAAAERVAEAEAHTRRRSRWLPWWKL